MQPGTDLAVAPDFCKWQLPPWFAHQLHIAQLGVDLQNAQQSLAPRVTLFLRLGLCLNAVSANAFPQNEGSGDGGGGAGGGGDGEGEGEGGCGGGGGSPAHCTVPVLVFMSPF